MAAVRRLGHNLEKASAALRKNKEVVMAAVQEDGYALDYASATLQNDKEFIMAAVQHKCLALQNVSAALKNDKEVVIVFQPSPRVSDQQEGYLWQKYERPGHHPLLV